MPLTHFLHGYYDKNGSFWKLGKGGHCLHELKWKG